jgi:hypothetical protein
MAFRFALVLSFTLIVASSGISDTKQEKGRLIRQESGISDTKQEKGRLIRQEKRETDSSDTIIGSSGELTPQSLAQKHRQASSAATTTTTGDCVTHNYRFVAGQKTAADNIGGRSHQGQCVAGTTKVEDIKMCQRALLHSIDAGKVFNADGSVRTNSQAVAADAAQGGDENLGEGHAVETMGEGPATMVPYLDTAYAYQKKEAYPQGCFFNDVTQQIEYNYWSDQDDPQHFYNTFPAATEGVNSFSICKRCLFKVVSHGTQCPNNYRLLDYSDSTTTRQADEDACMDYALDFNRNAAIEHLEVGGEIPQEVLADIATQQHHFPQEAQALSEQGTTYYNGHPKGCFIKPADTTTGDPARVLFNSNSAAWTDQVPQNSGFNRICMLTVS